MNRPPDAVWNECLEIIRDNISRQSFRTWFEPLNAIALDREDDESKLTVQLPSRFYYEWLEEHYHSLLRKTITKVLGPSGRLFYDIVIEREEIEDDGSHVAGGSMQLPARDRASGQPTMDTSRLSVTGLPGQFGTSPFPGQPSGIATKGQSVPRMFSLEQANPHAMVGVRRAEVDPNLNSGYTFERFIEGDCNRLARSAAWAIAQNPGSTAFNPFLIYGGVGLGKTHLIQAIGNYALENGTAESIMYVSSERFTGDFVRSIKQNNAGDFSQYYRNIDLLIVDDVQFFGGKEKTQEEFFHVFNALQQAGKQIILSADRPPKDIAGIEERLLSRFQCGLSADVQMPELETRIAILKRLAEETGTQVHPDVLDYIATHVKSNIRELEGALIRLQAHAALHGGEIDLVMARGVLRDLIVEAGVSLTVEEIQRVTCDFLKIPEDLVRARTRKREVVQARQVSMYFSKHLTNHSLKTIGLHFGGRDHSTVIHAVQSVEDQCDTDSAYRDMVEAVRKKLELHTR